MKHYDFTQLTKEDTYPYSIGEFYTGNGYDNIHSLFELLPHGSGIDYTWNIVQLKSNPKRFHCQNAFHAMDEYGGYCHTYDFTAIVDFTDDKFILHRVMLHDREHNCCGYDLRSYLDETIAWCLSDNNGKVITI